MLTLAQITKIGKIDSTYGNPETAVLQDNYLETKEGKISTTAINLKFVEVMGPLDEEILRRMMFKTNPADPKEFYHENRSTNRLRPEKSSDPVYRKIGKILKEYNGRWQSYIFGFINDELMIDLERRQMDEATYTHLYKTSAKNLLKEFEAESERKYNKTKKSAQN